MCLNKIFSPRNAGLLLASMLLCATTVRAAQPAISLNAGIHVINAEVVNTMASRSQGLMFRKSLAPNQGMLFVFDVTERHCMWMKNTLIPLAVAFIDEQGVILNVEEMQPQTEDSHCATGRARYALEMTAGWFSKRGLKPGLKLGGMDKAPGPQ
ncbi:MAG: DUF192 domain-containing protein [Betaproteobacteria bacterium]